MFAVCKDTKFLSFFQTFLRKKREVIRWQYKGFAKIWENREEMAILKMLENGLC
jgi:hypothetical protein